MEEESRMARAPRPRSKPPASPRRRGPKAVATGPRELRDRSSDAAARPATSPAAPTAIRQPVHAVEGSRSVPNQLAEPQPSPGTIDPRSIDLEALTTNLARLIEEGGRVVAAYLGPREDGTQKLGYSDEMADVIKTLGHVAEYWYA